MDGEAHSTRATSPQARSERSSRVCDDTSISSGLSAAHFLTQALTSVCSGDFFGPGRWPSRLSFAPQSHTTLRCRQLDRWQSRASTAHAAWLPLLSSLPYTSADARPMQPRYIGQTAPLTAFSCGEQVPDVGLPHYRDARMQHSQSK